MLIVCIDLLLTVYAFWFIMVLAVDCFRVEHDFDLLYEVLSRNGDIVCKLLRWYIFPEYRLILLPRCLAVRRELHKLASYCNSIDQSEKAEGLNKIRRSFRKCASPDLYHKLASKESVFDIIEDILQSEQTPG